MKTMRYGLEFVGERRRVRRTWGRTVMDVLMLLALAALCGWLWSCVKSAAHGSLFSVRGSLLAMATPSVSVVLAITALVMTGLMAWAVRAVIRNERWIEAERERRARERHLDELELKWSAGQLESLSEPLPDADEGIRAPKPKLRPVCVRGCQWECSCLDKELEWVPYENADEGIRAPGEPLPEDELRRIVWALLAETVAARGFVRSVAHGDQTLHDDQTALEAAEASLNLCVGCLRGLVERTQAGSLCHDDEGRGA